MDLARHVKTFTDFASGHLTSDESHDYNIRLKIDHSLRVLENGQAIVQRESIRGRTATLTTLACLYHDIGRFPQFARYNTYRDPDSVHHGRMGVLTLREIETPDDIGAADWKIIRAAVGLHNAKALNPATKGVLRTVVDVVRDADRIDIYAVILQHLSMTDNPQRVVIHSLEEHPDKFSEAVYETVLAGGDCDYASLRYSNDFILLLIGWLFTLTYSTSALLLKKRGLLAKAFSLLPQTDRIRALEDKANRFMHYKTHSPS